MNKIQVLLIVLCLAQGLSGVAAVPAFGKMAVEEDYSVMAPREMAERALVDTLYYNFEVWIERFKQRIAVLEARPDPNLEAERDLLSFYFYLAGLYGEFSHALSFTSKYQVSSIKEGFTRYSEKAKKQARKLLKRKDLDKAERAETFFFLGVAEGYVALLDYGEGHYLSALVNGLRADNHLEDALELDPDYPDALVGLGVYRYGSSRLGGMGNFLMQGGRDLRLEGIQHIERALKSDILSRPLALKTLIWFYISEQINPANADLPPSDPLSREVCRRRALELLEEYETRYFRDVKVPGFRGNKGLAVMKAIQHVLDEDYTAARAEFDRALQIARYLKTQKEFPINPQYLNTMQAAVEFCGLMQAVSHLEKAPDRHQVCASSLEQIRFIENGGSLIEYESAKIRREIQDVFYNRLKTAYREHHC